MKAPELQAYKEQIDAHSIISFDIFDTVLLRPVAVPSHLFWLMEAEVRALLDDPLFEFQKIRVQAEARARYNHAHAEEVTLDQIYEAFQEITCLEAEKVMHIKAKEIELELARCFANPCVAPLYHYALEAGKTIIFTSDIYLPKEYIQELLAKNGFYQQEHPLFISSELLKTKHHGTIYPYVLATLQCKPSEVLHIGDNALADIKQARRKGINTLHIPSHTERFFAVKRHQQLWGKPESINDIEMSLVIGHLAHYYSTSKPAAPEECKEPLTASWYAFGYHVVGVLYLGFIQWLLNTVKKQKIDEVFFLSRDGKIMQEALELVAPFYNGSVTSSYIYASRRALQVARIRKIDSIAQLYISTSKSALPVGEYLERIGMDPDHYLEAMQQAGFRDKNHVVASDWDRQNLQRFFKLIEKDMLAHAAREREYALGYYKSKGLGNSHKKQAVVDIGWGGMMLYALTDILQQQPHQLSGLFLGTTPLAKKVANLGFSIESYLFNFGEPYEYASPAYQCLEIVELLFSATHGSLAHFTLENGEYVPVLDEVDCSPERREAITQLQQGAMDFLRHIMPLLQHYPGLYIYPYLAVKPLSAILIKPTKAEASMFCHLTHIQDISATKSERMIVRRPPSLLYLLLKPSAFAAVYHSVYWKRGFLSLMGTSRFCVHVLSRIRNLWHDKYRRLLRV